MTFGKRSLENMVGKGENADNTQSFLPFQRTELYHLRHFKFKHIYFTSIEKQVLTTYTNLSRFCFLGSTPVLAPNVWADEKSQS